MVQEKADTCLLTIWDFYILIEILHFKFVLKNMSMNFTFTSTARNSALDNIVE